MEVVTSPHSSRRITSIESPQTLPTESASKSRHSVLPVRPGSCLPRVQLVPYAPASFSLSLTDLERELVNNTKFDAVDLASSDLEFEDIFTYGKPQQKLARVVEVSLPTRHRRKSSKPSGGYYDTGTRTRDEIKVRIGGVPQTKDCGRTSR
jgi:hypothetical protein